MRDFPGNVIAITNNIFDRIINLCPACASYVFSGVEESSAQETVSEDDSQEERERKERIPQRKADISRCWSKYCLDLLKSSRDKCVEEMIVNEAHEEASAHQGLGS